MRKIEIKNNNEICINKALVHISIGLTKKVHNVGLSSLSRCRVLKNYVFCLCTRAIFLF